jgi:Na+/H+ antiporter NhaD/arsenite permease-like protein
MNPAVASLLALLIAIVLSIATKINVGLIAIAFAWVIATYMSDLGAGAVAAGFPSGLFITLAGVTLLFAAAEANGTLERLTHRAARFARGDARLMPLLFFVLAALVSSVGPGAISSVALVAPLAMAMGYRAGVNPFLTALMVANGANAGNLSPISSVGIIANDAMSGVGFTGHEGKVFFANFAAHVLVAVAAYALLGGYKAEGRADAAPVAQGDLDGKQMLTIAVVAAWIAGVIFFNLALGPAAFAAAAILILARAVEDSVALKRVPWSVIVMVCGVTVLISVLEDTGGMDLFTGLLARMAAPSIINGAVAFVTGMISMYSSTSGVVLPAFLPTVPGLVERVGGGDPLAVALSINVGSSLVDVSPLSTLGALCLAALPAGENAPALFKRLFIWGLAMTVVGALISQIFMGVIARS